LILAHREEDELVDYKEAFLPESAKSWIALASDCAAFANTKGGYLVFGLKDKTWELVGVRRLSMPWPTRGRYTTRLIAA
jgi:predicted HTH transcriptional regulator